jgi:Carboxypeptidase regulatory-like domain
MILESHSILVSDDRGRFQFENLTAGRYNLRTSLRGYVRAEMKQLLVPHENDVTVDVSMRRDDGKLVVCQ